MSFIEKNAQFNQSARRLSRFVDNYGKICSYRSDVPTLDGPMRVLTITGAGISAESGIPTFRGKDGYWRSRQSGSDLDPIKLATPEAFERNPKLVWEWYRERRQKIRAAKPNAAHQALVRLAQDAREFLLVTQNVDDLHVRAGLPNEKMVQIHGDIFVTQCSQCDFGQNDGEDADIPRCPRCGALMRPGVVWFGEQLDPCKIDIVDSYLARGDVDLTLVIGTTALFGYILDWAIRARGQRGELIEINPDETPLSEFATKVVRAPAAVALPELVSAIVGQPHRSPK
jgi:NAD-dependent deacetylase